RQAEVLEEFTLLPADGATEGSGVAGAAPLSDVSRDEYIRRIERVLEYIRAGDIFQANFAQWFTANLRVPAAEGYARLRAASPAPFGCHLRLGGPEILSISPELFLARSGDTVATRPIKGTRPRSGDAATDARLHDELVSSEKDRAELAMIVDLLRNDLGRV